MGTEQAAGGCTRIVDWSETGEKEDPAILIPVQSLLDLAELDTLGEVGDPMEDLDQEPDVLLLPHLHGNVSTVLHCCGGGDGAGRRGCTVLYCTVQDTSSSNLAPAGSMIICVYEFVN